MEKIKIESFVELLKQGYSLNNIYILQAIKEGLHPEDFLTSPSGKAILQGMMRKSLISTSYKITECGEQLLKLAYSNTVEAIPTIKKEKSTATQKTDFFERWWTSFPGTDTFEYKGRKFAGSRALRTNKEECRALFNKIVREGFTGEEMLQSLEYEITQKKEDSLKRKENKLRFMQNSATYLRQRTWEPFIELARQGNNIKEEATSSSSITDI